MTSTQVAAGEDAAAFRGTRGEVARIAIVNTLLSAITLGIYRFWARTRLRQFYWRSIEVDGDTLEYTGRGMELFLGFLIVIAIFFPISLGIGAVQAFLALDWSDYAELTQLATFVVIWWLIGYAVYRARRYRLTRTLWRGIRCGQVGSPAGYAWMRFGWSLLALLSLGIAVPWYHIALRRYEMNNTRFGFSRFDYTGTGRELFRHWWPVMLAGVVFIAGVIMLGVGVEQMQEEQALQVSPGTVEATEPFKNVAQSGLAIAGAVLLAVGIIGYLLAQANYRVASLRYLFAMSSIEGITARSNVKLRRVILYGAILIGILLATFAGVYGFIIAIAIGSVATGSSVGFGLIPFVMMIVLFLVLGVAKQVFFEFPLIRHIVTTLEISDTAALDGVVQSTREDPRFGEGLLDALDIDLDVA